VELDTSAHCRQGLNGSVAILFRVRVYLLNETGLFSRLNPTDFYLLVRVFNSFEHYGVVWEDQFAQLMH